MKKILLYAVILIAVINSVVVGDQCNHDPFPPFPPSPAEFQSPVAVNQQGSNAILSWSPITGDGYTVLICEAGRFSPLAHEINKTDLVLSNFERLGHQEFLVMAYVKVGDNIIFNSGTTGSFEFQTVAKTNKSEVEVKLATEIVSKDAAKISMGDRASAVSSLPKFDGSHSFYSAKYPDVKNPFHEAILPTGEVVPPLLLDEEIEETVERMMVKPKSEAGPMVANLVKEGVKPGLMPKGVLAPTLSSNVDSGPSAGSTVSKNAKADSKAVVEAQAVSTPSDAPTEDKEEDSSSNIMIIIVVVILIIFFQLFKEGK
ncbi:hypothetical protein MJH12_18780 [bacterium]|nr:hypothetical protein [bacterium]